MKNKIILTGLLTLIFKMGLSQKNTAESSTIVFKVCFGNYSDTLIAKEERFKGVPEITFYADSVSKIYRFLSGEFKKTDDAISRKKILVEKGFGDAYIVAFKNGRRISISQALKTK